MKRILGITCSLSIAGTAMVATMSSASADTTSWCGDWLQNPNNTSTSTRSAVSGTYFTQDQEGSAEVRQGAYGGRWFAWTKLYPIDFVQGKEHLMWRYKSNNALYSCPDYSGTFTSGVPKTATSRVSAEFAGWYGPGVYWG